MPLLQMALIAIAVPSAAFAAIDVSPSVIIIEPGAKPETTITVTNSAKLITYVTVEPREIMARGEPDEKLRVDRNPATLGILTTPARMVLEAGERRGIRVLTTASPGETDRLWRIKVAPVAGKIKAGQSGVAFLIGYDILLIQRAVNATVAVTGKRDGRNVTFSNSGNSFGMIGEIKQCPATGECVKLPDAKRLYGGTSWSMTLPQDDGIVEVVVEGINNKRDVIKL